MGRENEEVIGVGCVTLKPITSQNSAVFMGQTPGRVNSCEQFRDNFKLNQGFYKVAFVSKNDWYEVGFKLLVESGASVITIDNLARQLEITKGSFYHHFKNYQDFKIGLLTYFEELTTSQTIETVEKLNKPGQKIEGLLNITKSNSANLEVAIRAWALQDKEVQAFQARLDTRRLAYLQELFGELGNPPALAQIMAQLFYSIYVGSSHIVPELPKEKLYAELSRLYNYQNFEERQGE